MINCLEGHVLARYHPSLVTRVCDLIPAWHVFHVVVMFMKADKGRYSIYYSTSVALEFWGYLAGGYINILKKLKY